KQRSGGCENDRLRINLTMHMPAKVGPKRVRALARAGCYFDSSAARCGAGLVLDLRRERRSCSCKRDCDARACGRTEDRVHAAPAVSCAKCANENAHEHTGSSETLRPQRRLRT